MIASNDRNKLLMRVHSDNEANIIQNSVRVFMMNVAAELEFFFKDILN